MTIKNILLLVAISTFIIIVITDFFCGKAKNKESRSVFWIRMIGVYGSLLLGISIVSYLITDTLIHHVLVSIILGVTALSWSLFVDKYMKDRNNYLFLLMLSLVTTLVFYTILPNLTLLIIPVYVLSAILGSFVGTIIATSSEIMVNKGKMVLVVVAMIVFQLAFVTFFNDKIETSSKPMSYALEYLNEQGMDTEDYFIFTSDKLYTRYDQIYITCLSRADHAKDMRLYYHDSKISNVQNK